MNKTIGILIFCIATPAASMERPLLMPTNAATFECSLPALVYYCKALNQCKKGPCGKEYEKLGDLKCHLRKEHSLSPKHIERFSGIKDHNPRFDM